MTLDQAIAAQRAHIYHKPSAVQFIGGHFLTYLIEHDEETFQYLLEALLDGGDGKILHSPSDLTWTASAIAPSILNEAGIDV